MEIIVAIANQVNGAFGVLILSLAGIGILLYKTGGWASEIKRYKQKTDKHDDNFKKVDANITALRSDLIEMTSSILNIVSSWQITQGHSPLTLTDKGEKIRKNLNADLIIKKYKYELLTYISDIGKINNPYDIQTLAFKA
ncbi:MAG: hypothetical protein LBT79_02835, partial [Elusimicrobiota bacterium]|nr:hypothetical protein [Elusimicrobiota bacterium]